MIISKIQGGLGNQLFQWAYGKALSLEFKDELLLDTSFYNTSTNRVFLLRNYKNLICNCSNNISIHGACAIINDNFKYKKINIIPNLIFLLNGYFQSEKYFKGVENEIKNTLKKPSDLTFDINPHDINVSIHVRRGDYLNLSQYHPVQTLEYYTNALDIIGKYDKCFIFSDDIKWCKDNLKFHNIVFVEENNEQKAIWMMSECTHNIIANSSFSWWGAWLNSNKEKIVISPKLWFGQAYSSFCVDDIYCDGWRRI